jgi:hypothetical protein
MILDAQDGETKVNICTSTNAFMQIMDEAHESSIKMGYEYDWRCLLNYIIAHYKGVFSGNTFYVNSPLEMH